MPCLALHGGLEFLVGALMMISCVAASSSLRGAQRNTTHTRIVHFPIGEAYAVIDVRTGRNSYGGAFWEMVETERWEPQTFLAFNTVITHLTTVIDFGAWIGPTSLYAAHFAKQVIALEPDIVAYAELHRNVQLNSDRLKNVHLYHRCISTRREAVTMNRGPNAPGDSMSTVNRNSGANSNGIPVQCDTLDKLSAEFSLQGPLFVKVDTEGMEVELVPAWRTFIQKTSPTMYLSMHQQLRKYTEEDKRKVIDVLRLFPYALEVKDCIRCPDTFTAISFNSTNSPALCIKCDYLLSFEKFF